MNMYNVCVTLLQAMARKKIAEAVGFRHDALHNFSLI